VTSRTSGIICNATATVAVVGAFAVAALWAFVVVRNIVSFLVAQ
jgi:hypothetical protein